MKKIMLVLISIFMMGLGAAQAQTLNAQPIKNITMSKNVNSLSSIDQNLIFGEQTDVMVLGNDEMKATQGEFWPLLLSIGFSLAVSSLYWLNAPGPNDQIHSGRVFSF